MKNFKGSFSLMRDKPFKKLFNDKEIFSDFMKSAYEFLNIDEGFHLDSLNSQVLISGGNIKVKDFFSDVFAVAGDILIILEAYNSYKIYEETKSFCYASRVYGSQLLEKEFYDSTKKVLCINIVNGKPKTSKTKLVETYRMSDGVEILDCDPIIFVTIYLDNIRNKLYTQSEQKFIKYLRVLSSTTLEEVKKIVKGDKIMNKTVDFINKFFTTPGNTRKDRIESDLETARHHGMSEGVAIGEKKGLERGKKEGVAIGEINKENQIIYHLYSKNYSIQNISDTLDIPVEEVQKRLTLGKNNGEQT